MKESERDRERERGSVTQRYEIEEIINSNAGLTGSQCSYRASTREEYVLHRTVTILVDGIEKK